MLYTICPNVFERVLTSALYVKKMEIQYVLFVFHNVITKE